MQCDLCAKKKATVHLTEIIDEQMSEMHLCEECAREKSVQMEQQFGLADLLAGLLEARPHGSWPTEAELPQTPSGLIRLQEAGPGQLHNVLPLPANYLPRPICDNCF